MSIYTDKIKAVIFDMDGLMIDSERITYEGYVRICGEMGLTVTPEYYGSILGVPQHDVYKRHREEFGDDFPSEQVVKEVQAYLQNSFETDGVPLKKGLTELLDRLTADGYKCVVATSSSRQRVDRILEMADLARYFDDVVCGDEIEHGKPAPDIFLRACERAEADPCEAIVLEDSENGIFAARNAHIRCICVPDMKMPGEEATAAAMKVIDDLTQAYDLISGIATAACSVD